MHAIELIVFLDILFMFFFLAHLAPDSGDPDAARCMAGYYPSETRSVASGCYYDVVDDTGRPYCCPYDRK